MSVERTIVCDQCGGIIAARRRLIDAVSDARTTGAEVNAQGDATCGRCLEGQS